MRKITFREWNGGKEKKIDLSNLKLMRPNQPNNCLTLDIYQYIRRHKNEQIKHLKIKFRKETDVIVEIEDRLNTVLRGHKFNKFGVTGPSISLNNLQKQIYKYFAVGFHEEIFVENDPLNECVIYPTKQYLSYKDCDSEFVKKYLASKFPPGFMPLWASDQIENVTTRISLKGNISSEDINAYKDIMVGATLSSCPLHCQKTKVRTAFIEEKFVNYNYSKIDITFAPSVSVDKTDFPKFELAKFLSSFGGLMGLWLGIGIMQSLEMVIGIRQYCKE